MTLLREEFEANRKLLYFIKPNSAKYIIKYVILCFVLVYPVEIITAKASTYQ